MTQRRPWFIFVIGATAPTKKGAPGGISLRDQYGRLIEFAKRDFVDATMTNLPVRGMCPAEIE
jgi:hypothetical protein